MRQDRFKQIISGQDKRAAACCLRIMLAVPAFFYSLAVRTRNLFYDGGVFKSHRVNAVVLSVGNITAGGTGKTPLVIWIYNHIKQKSKIKNQNCGCAILTRGYKTTQNYTDEPAVLAQNCPQAKVIVNPDRLAGAIEAINKFGAEVLIMDDGFQHRRLARDIDIITIDATLPFGYGRLLPAGLLREPISSIKRADAAVITRCDQIPDGELNRLEEKLKSVNPQMVIARTIHSPSRAKSIDNLEISLEELKGKNVFAFCGIGNPDAFLNTIRKLGLNLAGSKIYDDHYHYTDNDISEIYLQAEQKGADFVISTQKDWTSACALFDAHRRKKDVQHRIIPAYLEIKLKFLTAEDKITQLIENALAGKITGKQ